MIAHSKENYLKVIYQLTLEETKVSPVIISEKLGVSPSSVTDMIKKLSADNFVLYEKKKGVRLSENGHDIAIDIVRAHRLWECFLSKKLHYSWDQLHTIAEELEHIRAPELLTRLENYLNHPSFDPHGDPIPSSNGSIVDSNNQALSSMEPGNLVRLTGVKKDTTDFLKYLQKLNICIGSSIKVIDRLDFDGSFLICCEGKIYANISQYIASHLFVVILEP